MQVSFCRVYVTTNVCFTDAYTGWPGSVHDACVFDNSNLQKRNDENPFEMLPESSFILGDAAYKFESFIMVRYKDNGHLTADQKLFNYHQSATRNIVERAFALLKTRFCRLKYLEIKDEDLLCKYIIAIFYILHKMKI